jgi:dienelactone hydrolase
VSFGENDDWTPADACRKLANAEDDVGISRSKGEGAPLELKVFAGAYHGFDIPRAKPISYLCHHSPSTRRRRIRRATCYVPFSPRISDGRTDGSI